MVVYAIVLFAAAIAFAVFAVLISKGHTNLINCYHEERVKDKKTYCKKFRNALWFMTAVLTVSGSIGLLGETDTVALCAVGTLVAGMMIGVCQLFRVQKTYGGGVF